MTWPQDGWIMTAIHNNGNLKGREGEQSACE